MVIVRSTHRCVYTPSRPYLGGTTTSIPEMAPPWCPSYLWTLLQSNLAISGANELLILVWGAHNRCPRLQRLSKWSIGPRFAVNLRFHPRNAYAQNVPKTPQNAQNDALRNSCFLQTTCQQPMTCGQAGMVPGWARMVPHWGCLIVEGLLGGLWGHLSGMVPNMVPWFH